MLLCLLTWQYLEISPYDVCSNSIRIGIIAVVYCVGCVCNQSWHVRTCLSNSRHKLQVAAFAQLAVVGRGSNTCVYVIAIFTMCESTEQRIYIKFCFKIGKTATETYQLLQQAYGEDAMGRTQVFDWFRRFKEGRTSVESDPSCDGRFLILRVSYTTSTLPTGKQLTRNSTWRSCDFAWIKFAEKDWILHHDNAPASCAAVFGQTRHRSVAAAAILIRSRTVWLFPIPKA